jgi:hypothetical protein
MLMTYARPLGWLLSYRASTCNKGLSVDPIKHSNDSQIGVGGDLFCIVAGHAGRQHTRSLPTKYWRSTRKLPCCS